MNSFCCNVDKNIGFQSIPEDYHDLVFAERYYELGTNIIT